MISCNTNQTLQCGCKHCSPQQEIYAHYAYRYPVIRNVTLTIHIVGVLLLWSLLSLTFSLMYPFKVFLTQTYPLSSHLTLRRITLSIRGTYRLLLTWCFTYYWTGLLFSRAIVTQLKIVIKHMKCGWCIHRVVNQNIVRFFSRQILILLLGLFSHPSSHHTRILLCFY